MKAAGRIVRDVGRPYLRMRGFIGRLRPCARYWDLSVATRLRDLFVTGSESNMAKPAELFTDSLAEEIGRLGQSRRTTPVKLYEGIEAFSSAVATGCAVA